MEPWAFGLKLDPDLYGLLQAMYVPGPFSADSSYLNRKGLLKPRLHNIVFPRFIYNVL